MTACYFAAVQNNGNLVAHLYIGCAGYNLDHLGTDVYLTDNQLVRIRMLFDFFNLTHNDFFKVFIHSFKALYLGSGKGHSVAVFLVGTGKSRHICFNP